MKSSELIESYAKGSRAFFGSNLSGANLRRADLSDADLRRADLSDADLSGADLSAANLSDADLSCANLSGADLSAANLSNANLRGTDLRGTDLRGTGLRGADLRGADLRGADLRGADLRGADLRGADLRCTDLRCTVLPALFSPEPGLLARVAKAALASRSSLNMREWHTCDTTHCPGGWAVVLAENGRELEAASSTQFAARILLSADDPDAHLHFSDNDDQARAYLQSFLD